jgi:hypothetical protein
METPPVISMIFPARRKKSIWCRDNMENPPFVTDIPARNLHFDKVDNLPYELWA